MKGRHKVLILGKLPPPYMGPAIATKILLGSRLKEYFELYHLDTRINTSLDSIGKWSFKKVLKNISNYVQLIRINIKHRPSLVLIPISQSTTGFLKDFIFILLCRINGRKILLQLRGSNFKNWLESASLLMKAIVKISFKWSSGMIVLGHNLKYLFADYFPDERIFVIPNGGNFSFPAVDKGEPTHFLFFSNLFDAKGIRDVVEAVKILNERCPGLFHLDVAGSWLEKDTEKYCVELVKRNNLPVTFHPALSGEDKMKCFAAADVFIFTPRLPEGHPWVIIEAMAASLPVIATAKGAITESVIHEDNGFIVREKDPGAIASKMELLLKDNDLRMKMAKRSFEHYDAKFTEEKMSENYRQCFNIVIDNG